MVFRIPIEKLIKNTQNSKSEKDWMYEGDTKLMSSFIKLELKFRPVANIFQDVMV